MFKILETANHYFNYGDALLQNIIFTDWAKHKFNVWLLSIWALIIRLHVISVVCFFYSYNPFLDFFIHTGISIFFTIYRHWFYIFIEIWEDKNMILVDYLLDNYTARNYRRWKRYILLSLCVYGIVACLIFPVDSWVIIVYIIEYIIAFIIVDVVENSTLDKIILNYKNKPKHIIHANFTMDDDYDNLQCSDGEGEDEEITIDNDSVITGADVKKHNKNFGSISLLMIDEYDKTRLTAQN